MRIPAIKAQIGTWVYYISTLTFEQVSTYVKRVDDELHKSVLLREMLQRSITDNYKNIASYIENQDERFFNALILAVYDGEPKWHEVRLESEEIDEYIGLGVLELSGDEKIFPVDGQHRVEGIKKVVSESEKYNHEKIPVVFIGHKKDVEGMQRSRRLFSTLNRYAKPVSMRDIIALDEDDTVAIASRELIDSHPLFSQNRILDSKTKAIPDSNNTAFTTIITFYECNRIMLSHYLSDKNVLDNEGKRLKGNSKTREYIRIRPSDEQISEFEMLCQDYWDGISQEFEDISAYMKSTIPDTCALRNRDGGNLLFRPVALIPFTKAAIRIKNEGIVSFQDGFRTFPKPLLQLNNKIWRNVLWNAERKTMIMNNQFLTETILLFFWAPNILSAKEKSKMRSELKILNQLINDADVEEIIECALGDTDE